MFDAFIIPAIILFFIAIILPLINAYRTSGLRSKLNELSGEINQLKQLLADGVEQKPAAKPLDQQPLPAKKSPEQPQKSAKIQTEAQHEATKEKAEIKSASTTARSNLEENIASKWFVWVGAAAIALAGIFLVKYIAEQGILTPAVRMVLAFVMGATLAFGGEWVRRRPIQQMIAALKPSYVPMALTASGILVMYVTVFASYSLYELIGPLVAFGLLGFVSLVAFGLSILQGAPVAFLGLIGGLVTPALVSTGSGSVVGLFGYLAMVIVACAGVMRYRPWWWLGFAAAAGAGLWVLLWSFTQYGRGDVFVIGLFLAVVILALSLLVNVDEADKSSPERATILPQMQAHMDLPGYFAVALMTVAVCSVAYLLPLVVERFSGAALTLLGVVAGIIAAMAYARPRLSIVALGALGLPVAGFSLWGAANIVAGFGRDFGLEVDPVWQPELSPEVFRFLKWIAGFALVMGVGGFFVATRAAAKGHQPVYWLALSIIAPIALLIIAYLTFHASFADTNWAFAALVLALAALLACVLIRKAALKSPAKHDNLFLGLYAVAVVAGISLTMVFLLKDAWLTVALALQLPAIAWISNQLKLDLLRKIAFVIGAAIFIRLAANPFLADYAREHFFGQHWVLYGYGIPAVASHFAALWFRQQKDDALVVMLEGLRVVFAILLISAEIRIFATGDLLAWRFNLVEAALQSIVWLAVAWSRLRAFAISGRIVDKWSGYALLGLGLLMTFGASLLIKNPFLTGELVGRWFLFNTLFLAYIFPAGLIWFIIGLPLKNFTQKNQAMAGVGVLVLLFTYVTLETRHVFQGQSISHILATSEAEMYTYSVVWLVFAFALLMFGLIKKRAVSRYAALLVLVLTVLKVFLSDMNDLAGLWRVASFLGLGLSLVGIGYLYQRFLYLPQAEKKNELNQ